MPQALAHAFRLILIAIFALFSASAGAQEKSPDVGAFLQALWPDAAARGITRKTFDLALTGLTIDPRVKAATLRQPEFGRAVGAYVNGIATNQRIATAQAKAAQWTQTLAAIEQQYGVDRWTLLAIWGIETSFGGNNGGFDVIRSLATLTLIGYRPDFFRDELLAALQVLQEGHVARAKMIGSWAGAMGQPQFMPSNFLALAVDFDGDGKKDIWGNVPDVLASIAKYFKHWGWKAGAGWGHEVVVPQGFDYKRSRATYPEWAALGVTRPDGKALPTDGNAIMFFPSGAAGPAFLVGENFEVIKRYNNSDVFALAVSQLADRARGLGPVRAAWPMPDRQLSRLERIALQKRMQALGHPVNDFEGRIDFELRDEIRLEQEKHGLVPDGHPTPELLRKIGAVS
jgi:membrane-bound lytic murein transglycosylase B